MEKFNVMGESMDRTIRGLLAGVIAGIVKDSWNLIDYYFLHITEIRFLDWAAILATWSRPRNSLSTVFFLMLQILWDGFLGIIFAHLLISITTRYLILKSILFSLMLWFVFQIIVNLYRVPLLSGIQPQPGAISNVMAVILWGVIMGLVLKKLDKPAKV